MFEVQEVQHLNRLAIALTEVGPITITVIQLQASEMIYNCPVESRRTMYSHDTLALVLTNPSTNLEGYNVIVQVLEILSFLIHTLIVFGYWWRLNIRNYPLCIFQRQECAFRYICKKTISMYTCGLKVHSDHEKRLGDEARFHARF